MESESKTAAIDFSDSSIYTDEYLSQIMETSFNYFDHHIDKEHYESEVEQIISNFKSGELKPQNIKAHIKFFIDFIEKYSNADIKFINKFLLNIKLSQDFIDIFLKKLTGYIEQVDTFKNAMVHKISNNKILDFSHCFKVKFIDSSESKVSFVISLKIVYTDDNDDKQEIKMDLTLNQFYSLYEKFQKIDTLINTLI